MRTRIMGRFFAAALLVGGMNAVDAAELDWQTDMSVALKQSQATGKPMLIQMTAEWCHYCKKMKATTYADANVQKHVASRFVPVMLDADRHTALVAKLKLKGLPATVIVAPDLQILKRLNGYQRPATMISELSKIPGKSSIVAVAKPKTKQVSTPVKRTSKPAARSRVTTVSARVPVCRAEGSEYAFGGCCLVRLQDQRAYVSGDARFAREYRGVKVCFATATELALFNANPTKYWPKHDGLCVVTAKTGKRVCGQPRYGVMYRKNLWMFASLDHMQAFVKDPAPYLKVP